MALSNTATPKYYAKFRADVLSGRIPVNREIEQEMNRIDELVANPRYYYDDKAIDGFIAFCEEEATLTDGSPLVLLDSFKLWAESLLSWFYYVDRTVYIPSEGDHGGHHERRKILRRLRKKQYLIVARGAAKSMYGSLIQNYFLNVDTSTTHQVTVAPTMKQADEVMSPIRTAITRARGPLFAFLTEGSINNTTGPKFRRQKLSATKRGIENFLTGSLLEVRPMTVDKAQGLRPKVVTVDEWLSGDVREDVIGALEQGASKHEEYVILAISSEGTVRNGPGDDVKLELAKILRGEYYAPHISIFHYKLDEISEVSDPEMYPKANPNIGYTVSYETYLLDVERAEQAPATRNDILAKRFGIPMEGYTFFFTYEETIPHRTRNFWRMACSVGADLSRGDDFCAFTFLFPLRDGSFGVKTRSYISELTLQQLPPSLREKYEEFFSEGSLHVMPGSILDMEVVFDDLDQHITDSEYDVRALGYDPYNAREFVAKWERENGPHAIVKVQQGARTESVPLGEIKKLATARMLIFDELIMKYTMGNAITLEDTNGNRKLLKARHEAKIDNVAALMDAFVAFSLNKEEFE